MLYNQDCLDKLKEILLRKEQTLSVAESVTSGHLQAALSSAIDAMRFFQGGITAYNAGQKTRHLMVEPIYAKEHDCISEDVAATMARSSNQLFLSHYAIGITGYASKPPGTGITELFAFVAIAKGREVLLVRKLRSEGGNITQVQVDYTNQSLQLLLDLISERLK
ncbi:MAG TPA: CinA family protein [Anseongella sp.]|nr:CinA family protein [Anseongella sp.]